MPKREGQKPKNILRRIFNHILKNSCNAFVIGIELNGERYFVKSDQAAGLIGCLYRKALEQERAVVLPSKFLPFPDMSRFVNAQEL